MKSIFGGNKILWFCEKLHFHGHLNSRTSKPSSRVQVQCTLILYIFVDTNIRGSAEPHNPQKVHVVLDEIQSFHSV